MKTYLLILIIFFSIFSYGQDIIDWRGPGRTGVYNETNLLEKWSENGPELIWSIENIYKGYSSVSIANNSIYLTGIKDSSDVLIALDMLGNIKWEVPYGRAWNGSYNESRCTPTIENNNVYVSSGLGDIACINATTGNLIWSVKASENHDGAYGRWGLSESLLIVDNKAIFTPGGNQTTIVAFDKITGELIWKSKSLNDAPSYTSPLLISRNNKDLIVNVTANFIFGVLPETGKILWKFNFGEQKKQGARNNQTNTPLYKNGKIFVTSGYDHYSVMLNLSEDAESVSLAWVDSTLDVHHGGVVLVNGYIYGANWHHNRMGNWICLDWNTGKIQYNEEWLNKGSIISADGNLYCYEEKTGNVALVTATPKEFKVISSFKIPLGTGPHWSHPVIKDRVLYIRHMDALMAYDIKN
ncbi:MAG: PQQ-binding-like beta-propeller repeat protein [Bacteroidales bacterium]|jgi:outer membrane protein assembly factor BamB|nr:PQQ-binding-like beta-propeller repeat protein [Bacteroidales bacterium]